MTIQWTLVAAFLYLELAFITLLLLPFISPKIWQFVFYSRACKMIAAKANMYFTIFIVVLILFFLDSVREMMKYSTKSMKDYEAELQMNMKLFRSQRNYYISGFTVFLWLVIRRLVMLILDEAELLSETQTAMKRAQSATETVEKLLKKEKIVKSVSNPLENVECNEVVANLRKALQFTNKEIESAKISLHDMESKAKEVSKEYEILLQKRMELQHHHAESKSD